jgi:hypothetical protein
MVQFAAYNLYFRMVGTKQSYDVSISRFDSTRIFPKPLPKKDCFAIYFDLFNATTFVIFNQLVGVGHPITHTCKCFSRCRPFTRS